MQSNGQDVSGQPTHATRTFNLASFSGGIGSIDETTGEGEITWESDAVWKVQVKTPGGNPPALLLSDPILQIAEDGTGSLSFEVGATAGEAMGGAQLSAVDPLRVVTQTFSDVSVAGGSITAVPDYAGVVNEAVTNQLEGGGSWPSEYVAQIPESVRAFHYDTGSVNPNKGPLPFTATFEATNPTEPVAPPKIELFDAEGAPLGDTLVEEGDVITFRGSGFDPQANVPGGEGGLPIPYDQPQGVFIAFGAVADPWRPSQDGPSENRAQVRGNTKWALLESVVDGLSAELQETIRAQAVTMNEDGTFEGQIVGAEPERIPTNGSFGVYTYAGGVGTVNPAEELFVPVNFDAQNTGGEAPPVPVEGSELVWGFKESWRGYLSDQAKATTTPGASARDTEDGLYRSSCLMSIGPGTIDACLT